MKKFTSILVLLFSVVLLNTAKANTERERCDACTGSYHASSLCVDANTEYWIVKTFDKDAYLIETTQRFCDGSVVFKKWNGTGWELSSTTQPRAGSNASAATAINTYWQNPDTSAAIDWVVTGQDKNNDTTYIVYKWNDMIQYVDYTIPDPLENLVPANYVTLYPVPASTTITIDFDPIAFGKGKVDLYIFKADGTMYAPIISGINMKENNWKYTLDVSTYPVGAYTLNFKTAKFGTARSFTIAR